MALSNAEKVKAYQHRRQEAQKELERDRDTLRLILAVAVSHGVAVEGEQQWPKVAAVMKFLRTNGPPLGPAANDPKHPMHQK